MASVNEECANEGGLRSKAW